MQPQLLPLIGTLSDQNQSIYEYLQVLEVKVNSTWPEFVLFPMTRRMVTLVIWKEPPLYFGMVILTFESASISVRQICSCNMCAKLETEVFRSLQSKKPSTRKARRTKRKKKKKKKKKRKKKLLWIPRWESLGCFSPTKVKLLRIDSTTIAEVFTRSMPEEAKKDPCFLFGFLFKKKFIVTFKTLIFLPVCVPTFPMQGGHYPLLTFWNFCHPSLVGFVLYCTVAERCKIFSQLHIRWRALAAWIGGRENNCIRCRHSLLHFFCIADAAFPWTMREQRCSLLKSEACCTSAFTSSFPRSRVRWLWHVLFCTEIFPIDLTDSPPSGWHGTGRRGCSARQRRQAARDSASRGAGRPVPRLALQHPFRYQVGRGTNRRGETRAGLPRALQRRQRWVRHVILALSVASEFS